MKRILLLLLTLAALQAGATGKECLHVFYISTRNREPQPAYRERIHRMLADIQDFYRTEMERNGYPEMTFSLDLDANGKTVIHQITLEWDFEPEGAFSVKKVRPLIAARLQKEKGLALDESHILIYSDGYWKDGDSWRYDIPYHGNGNPESGSAWVADHALLDPVNFDPALTEIFNDRGQKLTTGQFNVKMIGGVAHEFGHALGLPHNRETQAEKRKLGTALMGS